MSSDIKAQIIATVIAAVLAIIGSLLGGWIGARATREAMKDSIAASDRLRREAEQQERRAALDALLRELRLNVEYADKARADDAWVPFQTSALHQAQQFLASLTPYTYHAIQQATLSMTRYNTLAGYSNHHGDADLEQRAGQDSKGFELYRGTRRRPDAVLKALAQEAKEDIQRAADDLAEALAAEPPATVHVGRRR